MSDKQYKVIDLSGFGNSGKTALTNIFQEFTPKYWVSEVEFEFEIIRIKGGLIDLENTIVHSWSPNRVSTTLFDFLKLTKILAYSPNKYNIIGKLISSGMNLDRRFNGRFKILSEAFFNDLIYIKYNSYSLFPFQNMSSIRYAFFKLLVKINYRKLAKEEVILTTNSAIDFLEKTRKYLNNLMSALDLDNKADIIVLNNAVEPYNPLQGLNLFYNAKQIVVDRDPRDIYLSSLQIDAFVGNKHQGFSGNNVDEFIHRYRLIRENSPIELYEEHPKLMKITFEDLVLNYENTLKKIFKFLGEDESIHINKKKYFDPEISKRGVGMWKNVDGELKKDIDKISLELKEYCKNY